MSQDDGGWGDGAASEEKEFFFDGSEHSKDDLGGGDVVDKEGCYHFEITDVKCEFEPLNNKGEPRGPSILFTCEVLEGVKGQSPKGSKLFHRIYLQQSDGSPPKEGSVKSALRFGLGIGVLKLIKDGKDGEREIPADAETGSPKISSKAWLRAKNKQFMSKIVKEADTDKYKGKHAIPFGECGSPSDPKYADVPKNRPAMMAAGYMPLPPPDKSQKPANPPAGQTQQQTPPPAAAGGDDDDWMKGL